MEMFKNFWFRNIGIEAQDQVVCSLITKLNSQTSIPAGLTEGPETQMETEEAEEASIVNILESNAEDSMDLYEELVQS